MARNYGYANKGSEIDGYRRSHKKIPTKMAMQDDQDELKAKQAAIGKMGPAGKAQRQGIVPLANYMPGGSGLDMSQARKLSPGGGTNEPNTGDPNTNRSDPHVNDGGSGSSGSGSSGSSLAGAVGGLRQPTAGEAAADKANFDVEVAVAEQAAEAAVNRLREPNIPEVAELLPGADSQINPYTGAFVPDITTSTSNDGTLTTGTGQTIDANQDMSRGDGTTGPSRFDVMSGEYFGGGGAGATVTEEEVGPDGAWYDSISERIGRLDDPDAANKRVARQRAAAEAQIRATMGSGEAGRSGAAALLQGEAGRLAEEQARTAELAKELDLAELESYMMGFDLEKERYDETEKRQAMKAAYYMGSEYDMDYDAVMDFLGFNDAVRDDASRNAYNRWHETIEGFRDVVDPINPDEDGTVVTFSGFTEQVDDYIMGGQRVEPSEVSEDWTEVEETDWGEGENSNRRYVLYKDGNGNKYYVLYTRVPA